MDQITKAKTVQAEITQALHRDDIEQMAQKFDELDALYGAINAVVQEVRLVRQNCRTEIVNRLRKIRADVEILEQDHPTACEIQQLQQRDHGTRELAPGINVPVVSVATEDFIPDGPLYHVRDTDEYAIRVNGTIIRGQIRNFADGTTAVRCHRGASCVEPQCAYGHPAGHPGPELTWSRGAWLHTEEPLQKKNMHMRHVGSRRTLSADIEAATRTELACRAEQTAHDLLIQIAVDQLRRGQN